MVGNMNNPDLFVFEKPIFNDVQKCIQWVNMNPQEWVPPVLDAFGPDRRIETVLCVKEKKLKEILTIEEENYIKA